MALGGDFDEFEKRKMEALGYIWGGSGWLTVGVDNGNTMIVWPYKGNNNYTTTDGYGSGYVNIPNQPNSLGSNVPGEKSLGQIQEEKAYFEKVASEAELQLSATRIKMAIVSEKTSSLSGVDLLRNQVELAVDSIEEITLETELDGAKANAIHADLMMQGRLKVAEKPHYSEQQNSEKRQERDMLKNKIVIKQNEKERRVAELNRLNAELELVNKGQDIREVVATRDLDSANRVVNQLNQNKQSLQNDLNSQNKQSVESRAKAEDFKNRREKMQFPNDDMKQREYEVEMNRVYRENLALSEKFSLQAKETQKLLNEAILNINDANKSKEEKQSSLDAVRSQIAKEVAELKRRQEDARKKEEAATRAREEMEKIARETEAKNRELELVWQKVGIIPAPLYDSKMISVAEASLGAAGVMALSQAPGSMQLSVAGSGVWTAGGGGVSGLATAIGRGVSALGATATASVVGPMVAAASTILFSSSVGQGSDKVPGRNAEAMFAMNAQLLAAQSNKIEPGKKSVDLPVRGQLVNNNGQLTLQLLKTGSDTLPASVPVLVAVRDAATGLDKITVPAVEGSPELTILVNPALPPKTPLDTGNQNPVPLTPVHTGTTPTAVEMPVTTVTPVHDVSGLQDFIYWRPDAAGTGVEPVYVMLLNPRYLPGKVSGKGERVVGSWLKDANKNIGSPIPSQIADKLRGREFSSFDNFRKAFWTEVSKDPELSKQFKAGNFGNIKAGKAPASAESEQVGGRIKYELHHVNPAKNNGEIYNIDNIRVTTPKNHINIHRASK